MADLERLTAAIRKLHGCDSVHVQSIPVKETFQGGTVWEGVVEQFTLIRHPKAKRCYAWATEDEGSTRYVAVLEIPPVNSAQTAVRMSIAADFRSKD